MTSEDALALLEPLLNSQYLSQTQKAIFQKVWEGQSYVEIAIAIGYDHGYVKDTGAQIWKLLSQVLDKKVTKNNVRNVICGFAQQLNNTQTIPSTSNMTGSSPSWGEAADVTSFHGREAEQACLENWIVEDRCRLVALLGIGGVGKTALSIKLAKQVQGQFDYVVWRSLRHA
ncbi:MAG: NB-ARC domain-containing protein, partial [Cyanobacteria bacterium P01_D01_bin.128]